MSSKPLKWLAVAIAGFFFSGQVAWGGGKGEMDLHTAASKGDEKAVAQLIESGAQVNAKSPRAGWVPLHWACFAGHKKVAFQLVEAGAKLNVTGKRGWTPLHLAAYKGHKSVTEFLLERGAETDCENEKSRTPLHLAVSRAHGEIVELLIKNGSNVGNVDELGNVPLHLAARTNDLKTVKLLIEMGARVNARNKRGETPIFDAVRNAQRAVFWLLAKSGAEIKIKDKNGRSLLHIAAERGHADFLPLLIKSDLDVNGRDKDGNTPLHLAARNGRKEAVAFLLEKMKNINLTNKHDRTPLHLAAEGEKKRLSFEPPFERHCGVVALLLAGGARIDAKDNDGRTPLHLAALKGHENVVAVLLENGAKSNAKGDDGHTAFDLARKGKHAAVLKALKFSREELKDFVQSIKKKEGVLEGLRRASPRKKDDFGNKLSSGDTETDGMEQGKGQGVIVKSHPFYVVEVRYKAQDWNVNSQGISFLVERFHRVVAPNAVTKRPAVTIAKLPALVKDKAAAVAYISGSLKKKFSEKEVKSLRKFLDGGGLLFADSATDSFSKRFNALMGRVFPDWNELFKKLPKNHQLYCGSLVPYCLSEGCPIFRKKVGWGETGYAYSVKGRLMVFYSGGNLGAGWAAAKTKKPRKGLENGRSKRAELAVRMGLNVLSYWRLYTMRGGG
ncbi:MAG: ankyrin repeat domain-containing protein [Planctomycetes bacterium]|nr:ankyrin repeat domain-containing protein [Planctomycetota bacterium]